MRKRHSTHTPPALEWLRDVSGGSARVTSLGNCALLVENHRGVRSFSDAEILLDSGSGVLAVQGSGLRLEDVRRDALVIRGTIRGVIFPCGEGGHEA